MKNLRKALQSNSELCDLIFSESNSEYLKYLDLLFKELYDRSCTGIEIKISETSPDLYRFHSLISELEFARFFLENNMEVKLLSDNAFESRSPPDMYVSNSNDYFVEVKNIQHDEIDYGFGLQISNILNSKGESYMIVIKPSSDLSTPTFRYEEKYEKEKYLNKVLDEFSSQLHVLKNSTPPHHIITSYAEIELHEAKKDKSHLGMGIFSSFAEPSSYGERIKYDVLQKAKKRSKWVANELIKKYIVAIDDESTLFYQDKYNIKLFGHATHHLGVIPDITLSREIKNAINNGWEKYLRKMNVLLNDKTVILEDNRGLFFTEPNTKNITALLVRNKNRYYLIANPFANSKINNPDIFNEFKNCITGWE